MACMKCTQSMHISEGVLARSSVLYVCVELEELQRAYDYLQYPKSPRTSCNTYLQMKLMKLHELHEN
jgi:hypothetical protein